jgi:hypothetical protein
VPEAQSGRNRRGRRDRLDSLVTGYSVARLPVPLILRTFQVYVACRVLLCADFPQTPVRRLASLANVVSKKPVVGEVVRLRSKWELRLTGDHSGCKKAV